MAGIGLGFVVQCVGYDLAGNVLRFGQILEHLNEFQCSSHPEVACGCQLILNGDAQPVLVFKQGEVQGPLQIIALHQFAVGFNKGLGHHEPLFRSRIYVHISDEFIGPTRSLERTAVVVFSVFMAFGSAVAQFYRWALSHV
jgi:hypothetical protein